MTKHKLVPLLTLSPQIANVVPMRTTHQQVAHQATKHMERTGVPLDRLSQELGITAKTLQKKLDGTTPFTITEVDTFAKTLDIQPAELFKDAA